MSTTDKPLSLYARLQAAGIDCSNWASDLYFPVTEQTTAILAQAAADGVVILANVTRFTCQVSHRPHYDAPFHFGPYWTARDHAVAWRASRVLSPAGQAVAEALKGAQQ